MISTRSPSFASLVSSWAITFVDSVTTRPYLGWRFLRSTVTVMLFSILSLTTRPTMTLRGVRPSETSRLTMLGFAQDLPWRLDGDGVSFDLPWLAPQDLPCRHAWTFRITDAQALAEKPGGE